MPVEVLERPSLENAGKALFISLSLCQYLPVKVEIVWREGEKREKRIKYGE